MLQRTAVFVVIAWTLLAHWPPCALEDVSGQIPGLNGTGPTPSSGLKKGSAAASSTNLSLRAEAWHADAPIYDLCFVDARTGWAVGDRGAIWHTADAGQHWQLQNSTVNVALRSVHFVDAQHGWAVGGRTEPTTHINRGVLLRTVNGGQTWKCDSRQMLPSLNHVRFKNLRHGCVAGQTSRLFGSSLFKTENGGQDWTPIAIEQTTDVRTADVSSANVNANGNANGSANISAANIAATDILAADFDAAGGVVANDAGQLFALNQQQVAPAQRASLGLRHIRGLQYSGQSASWAVGDGGLCLLSNDGARTWHPPAGALPEIVQANFDFAAVAVRGAKIWIVGSPGSRVFHSADDGRSWQSFTTGQSLPLKCIHFVDDQTGWAAGAMGLILQTRDGGRTWQKQCSGGERLTLLGIYSTPDDLPLEMFARATHSDGYLGGAVTLNRRDVECESPRDRGLDSRASEALGLLRASSVERAWQFPLRQRGIEFDERQAVQLWQNTSSVTIEEYLVRQLRTWRPDVITTYDVAVNDRQPIRYLVSQAVLQAVERAGDPESYSHQISDCGLTPWQVSKVFGQSTDGKVGGISLASAQLDQRSGRSFAEIAGPSLALLERPSSATMQFLPLVNRLPHASGRGDLFSGLASPTAGSARRAASTTTAETSETFRRTAQRRRNLQAIVGRTSNTDDAPRAQWLATVTDLTTSLDDESAAELMYQLGHRYAAAGQWELAAESFAMLSTRYRSAAMTPAALRWLVQYYGSAETALRLASQQTLIEKQQVGQQPIGQQQVEQSQTDSGIRQASATLPLANTAPPNQQSTAPVPSTPALAQSYGKLLAVRRQRALQFAAELERADPLAHAEPSVRWPLYQNLFAVQRTQDAQRILNLFRQPVDAHSVSADGERWLASGRGTPPKSIVKCTKAVERPQLDGELSDAIWKAAKPIELRSAQSDDQHWPCRAMLSYDHEFLYLAIEATRVPGRLYPHSDEVRTRDADLSQHDRVELLIDTDRDYAVHYRLSIDSRGWNRESCWGDANWNPRWYVASATHESKWIVEAAIPLADLSAERATAKTVWNVGLQRIIPATDFQSWTMPAAIDPLPEGFGYLMFE